MSKVKKTLEHVLRGTSDANVAFRDLTKLLDALGFGCHIRGDHYIYHREGLPEIINLQPIGSKAKAYQVKQVRNLILKHKLGDKL